MATGTELIQNAFIEIHVFEPGEPLNPEDSTFGLVKLNRLLDSWATKRLNVFYVGHASFAFGVAQQSYSIGPTGADFTAARPTRIKYANVLLVSTTPNARIPLDVLNIQEYAALDVPAQTSSFPSRLYYQPTNPNGTLWPWPNPTDTANLLELFTWNQLSQIAVADVGDEYNLPPGYEDAITLSLARTLLSAYGKTLTAELKRDQQNAMADIQALNTQSPRLSSRDDGMPGGERKGNILTGVRN